MADRRAKKHDVNYNIKRNYIKKKFPLTHTDSERVNEILINVGLEDPKNLNTSQMGLKHIFYIKILFWNISKWPKCEFE